MIIIIDKTPSPHPFRDVSELGAAPFTAAVPRALWPSKPLRLSGLDFYRTYYEGEGVSSSAITAQGSLYLYGGVCR